MNDLNMPATLPGSMKDQIRALAPYMINHVLKANGGWVADYKIPIDAFITADINHEELAKYNLRLSVTVEAPEEFGSGICGRVVNQSRYADVELTYK